MLAKIKLANHTFSGDTCQTPNEHRQGLQGRPMLKEREMLLFEFKSADYHTFHMGSVNYPIDIVWCAWGRITKVAKNCQPHSKDTWTGYGNIVVELLGGTCQKLGIGENLMFKRVAVAPDEILEATPEQYKKKQREHEREQEDLTYDHAYRRKLKEPYAQGISSYFEEPLYHTNIDETPRDVPPLDVSDLFKDIEEMKARILAVVALATPEEIEFWSRWYFLARDDVRQIAQKYNLSFPNVAAAAAALSPGSKWTLNLQALERIIRVWLMLQQGLLTEGDIPLAKIPAYPKNIQKAISLLEYDGTPPAEAISKDGPKVQAFYLSLLDPRINEERLVLDGHAINIARGERLGLKGLRAPTIKEREAMLTAYTEAADELGIKVQALQALTWFIWKVYVKGETKAQNKQAQSIFGFGEELPTNWSVSQVERVINVVSNRIASYRFQNAPVLHYQGHLRDEGEGPHHIAKGAADVGVRINTHSNLSVYLEIPVFIREGVPQTPTVFKFAGVYYPLAQESFDKVLATHTFYDTHHNLYAQPGEDEILPQQRRPIVHAI